jgi:hypothetical protein
MGTIAYISIGYNPGLTAPINCSRDFLNETEHTSSGHIGGAKNVPPIGPLKTLVAIPMCPESVSQVGTHQLRKRCNHHHASISLWSCRKQMQTYETTNKSKLWYHSSLRAWDV